MDIKEEFLLRLLAIFMRSSLCKDQCDTQNGFFAVDGLMCGRYNSTTLRATPLSQCKEQCRRRSECAGFDSTPAAEGGQTQGSLIDCWLGNFPRQCTGSAGPFNLRENANFTYFLRVPDANAEEPPAVTDMAFPDDTDSLASAFAGVIKSLLGQGYLTAREAQSSAAHHRTIVTLAVAVCVLAAALVLSLVAHWRRRLHRWPSTMARASQRYSVSRDGKPGATATCAPNEAPGRSPTPLSPAQAATATGSDASPTAADTPLDDAGDYLRLSATGVSHEYLQLAAADGLDVAVRQTAAAQPPDRPATRHQSGEDFYNDVEDLLETNSSQQPRSPAPDTRDARLRTVGQPPAGGSSRQPVEHEVCTDDGGSSAYVDVQDGRGGSGKFVTVSQT